ncbi:uncharacterized protein LOC124670476 [Lolium rigidum]|uniref:uncharacterized protein LOC124670476 n=1 Tax=Lolium rigidum TaxID=89674 RepID=UPI001F5DE312|nr:uncharacterized protein LOC124670476 [Lolium rigidum]
MGLCMSSCGAAAAVRSERLPAASTAMVLLPTGELREYPRGTTAAQALEGLQGFLCDADAMGFEGPAPAVGAGEELRPGQIYFVLPSEARRSGLRREDVAALAVTASAALVDRANAAANAASGGSLRRRRAMSVSPLVFAPPPEEAGGNRAAYKTVPAMLAKRCPVGRVKSAGRMLPRFAPDLSAIPECETYE